MTIPTACPTCGLPVGPGSPCPLCGAAPSTSVGDLNTAADVPASCPAAATGPSVFGRFTVLSRLGEGAFGIVYRARDSRLDREVALKVAKSLAVGDDRRTRRFLREARAAANLRHPNVVPLYESGQDGDNLYIASAFIPGRTLQAELAAGPLAPRRAAEVVRRLADALAYAHRQGIVHRDIKPANVMIDEAGEPLVMDFGLAARAEEDADLTQEGAAIGTPRYMSPEQAAGRSADAGPAADQYSLGVVLYEMLTGQPPFTGGPQEVMYRHVHTEPVPPRAVNPTVPRDLDTICRKCLAKEPAERYPSCGELADDLRRWLDGEPVRARRQGPAERAWRAARRNPVLTAVGAVAVLALAAVAVVASLSAAEQTRLASIASSKQALAEGEATRANAAEATVRGQNTELAQQLAEIRRRSYNDELTLARGEWLADDAGSARSRLRRLADSPFRSWEHDYLDRVTTALTLSGEGQRGEFSTVDWSPDGCWVAAGATDGGIRVWDARTGRLVRALLGHDRFPTAVRFGPRPGQLVSCGSDGTAHLWDVADGSGEVVFRPAPGVLVRDAAFHPTSGRLAIATTVLGPGGGSARAVIVDPGTGKADGPLDEPSAGAADSVAWSPDGAWVALSGESEARIRELEGEKRRVTLRSPGSRFRGLAFSPDSKRIAAGSESGVVRVWSLPDGREVFALAGSPLGTGRPAFSADGRRLACGCGRSVRVWDADTGRELFTLRSHTGNVLTAAFSPDGTRLVACGGGMGAGGEVVSGDVRLWEAVREPGLEVRQVVDRSGSGPVRKPPAYLLLAPGGGSVVGGGRCLPLTPGRVEVALTAGNAVFAPSGRLAAVMPMLTSMKAECRVFDLVRGTAGSPFPLAAGEAVVALADDGTLATANPMEVRVARAGGQTRIPEAGVTAAAFGPGRLALASPGNLSVRDSADGRELWREELTADGRLFSPTQVVFAPEGGLLALAGPGVLRVRRGDGGGGMAIAVGAGPFRITFGDDGRRLAVATDAAVRVFDPETGQELFGFPAPGLGGSPPTSPQELISRRYAFTDVALGGGILSAGCTDGNVYRWGPVGPVAPPAPAPAVVLFSVGAIGPAARYDPLAILPPDPNLPPQPTVRRLLESLAARNLRVAVELDGLRAGFLEEPALLPAGKATVGALLEAVARQGGGRVTTRGPWVAIQR